MSASRPSRPLVHARVTPRLAAVGIGVATTALLVVGSRVAGADPMATTPVRSCPEIVAAHARDTPPGWRVDCAAAFPTEWQAASDTGSAMSSRSQRRIVVLDGQNPAYLESALAHELAHAESSAWPAELKVEFARAVGQERWAGDGGPASPMEVFAESSVRCRGLPTHLSYPLVPCTLVEAARTAGGAAAPLPVDGSAPRD